MINDLFINALLLISVTFVAGHILKDVSKDNINTIYGKILLGISGGFVGILLMVYTIRIDGTTTIIDLRNFALMMVSYIGGDYTYYSYRNYYCVISYIILWYK